jgi:hypothetical protein
VVVCDRRNVHARRHAGPVAPLRWCGAPWRVVTSGSSVAVSGGHRRRAVSAAGASCGCRRTAGSAAAWGRGRRISRGSRWAARTRGRSSGARATAACAPPPEVRRSLLWSRVSGFGCFCHLGMVVRIFCELYRHLNHREIQRGNVTEEGHACSAVSGINFVGGIVGNKDEFASSSFWVVVGRGVDMLIVLDSASDCVTGMSLCCVA